MPIIVNEETKEFHLQGKNTSYLFTVLKNGQLGQLYYGKKIRHQRQFCHMLQMPNEPIGNATFPFKGDGTFSLEFLKQEYPAYGTTDFREPAIEISSPESRIAHFEYDSYEIVQGKPSLEGLPAVYTEHPSEAETLVITLKDSVQKSALELSYTVFHERDVITRSARLTNEGEQTLNLQRLMSMSVDLPTDEYDFIHLDGAWIRERHLSCHRLRKGLQSIDSKRGTSSSQHNPFIALKTPDANEHEGEVYGFSLVYSGNFFAGVEVDHYSTSRVLMGINPFGFEWQLQSGESFQTPEVVMVYSDQGLNGMSQTYHDLFGKRLARGHWRDRERPILVNNWEATYFDFNEEKILNITSEAAQLGIELFVLDDGWFAGRNDDTTSLGDWYPDKKKLPNGMEGLSRKVREQGLQFGLWVEPEMISENSELYRKHPEWVLGEQNRTLSHGRNQFILDLTNREVREYLVHTLSELFSTADVSYVKWDMNRNMTEIGTRTLPFEKQGETAHRYILGLYEILDRLTAAFPHILLESCASGGNRFDPGMLYYAPQAWTSDNTDAVERLKIQYGTSLVYPVSSMGAHVSSVPNHQTGRNTPINTRFHTAMFGAFGYELDPGKLSEEEKATVKEQIAFYKSNRKLLQFGTFHRLLSPFAGNDTAWMVTSPDRDEALLSFYRVLSQPNSGVGRIKLKGLDPDKNYRLQGTDHVFGGDELMNAGFLLPAFYTGTVKLEHSFFAGDFQSKVWKFTAAD